MSNSYPQPGAWDAYVARRSVIKGGAAVGAFAVGGSVLAACGGSDSFSGEIGSASGTLNIGSNASDPAPQAGLQAVVNAFPNADVDVVINTLDHNTYQENINAILQAGEDDVLAWFAGFRNKFFADQGLLGDITDVWDTGLSDSLGEGFKTASTGNDGRQYFVPWGYYIWGCYYRPSLFEENGWSTPSNLEELQSLASDMQDAGITPFAFANDGNWPAMGTFDQLNFRLNGYQFHVDLMAGNESWTDDRVRNVFAVWESLLPIHQENPNGRTWEEAAAAVVNKEAGMMTIGTFIGSQFPDGDTSDLDFFTFPELDPEIGTGTVEAPIDGWMMAASPANEAAAKEMLYHFGTPLAQSAYLEEDPSVVAPSEEVTVEYSPLQQKVLEAVAAAPTVTQFLDRDTSPEFASNVAGPRLADFLADPSQIDSILEDMQAQAEVILGGSE